MTGDSRGESYGATGYEKHAVAKWGSYLGDPTLGRCCLSRETVVW
jgi:hypothetical protein